MVTIVALPQIVVNVAPPSHIPPEFVNKKIKVPEWPRPASRFFIFGRINHNIFLFLAVAFFSLSMRITKRWDITLKEKLNTELLYLRAQINPHFLFNTLNSIYSLALTRSELTADAIQKLSSMMRYVLTESAHDKVLLEKEIDYIKNYIDLQRLRFGKDVVLNYSIWGDAGNKEIAPLILISFIENAFKYGMNPAEDTMIKIVINMYEERLEMIVINNKVTIKIGDEQRSGVGIENTKSRLELLYPYSHELSISETEKQFTVNLSIKLK